MSFSFMQNMKAETSMKGREVDSDGTATAKNRLCKGYTKTENILQTWSNLHKFQLTPVLQFQDFWFLLFK